MENNGDFKFDKKILDVKLETEDDPDWNYDNEFKTEEDSPKKKQSKKRIKCEICSKTFNKTSWLKEHMAKKHAEQNNSTGAFYQLFVRSSSATSFEPISGNVDTPLGKY